MFTFAKLWERKHLQKNFIICYCFVLLSLFFSILSFCSVRLIFLIYDGTTSMKLGVSATQTHFCLLRHIFVCIQMEFPWTYFDRLKDNQPTASWSRTGGSWPSTCTRRSPRRSRQSGKRCRKPTRIIRLISLILNLEKLSWFDAMAWVIEIRKGFLKGTCYTERAVSAFNLYLGSFNETF